MAESKDLSLSDLWLMIRKHRILLLCVTLGSAALGFGYGIHRCLGQQLARIELQVVFAKLFHRFPTLRVAESVDSLPFKYDSQIYGLYRFPVAW